VLFKNWALADPAPFPSRARNITAIDTGYARLAAALPWPTVVAPISDGFEAVGNGCVLDVAEGERLVWTSALGPGWRPNDLGPEGCGALAFTAIMSLEDAGDARTLYRAIAMHRNPADAETHSKMGFHDGWGTCADQLGEVAAELAR